ncbi:hypothetical protein Tco_1554548 [Tanacetum coccineum]
MATFILHPSLKFGDSNVGSEVDIENTGSDVDGKENVCDGVMTIENVVGFCGFPPVTYTAVSSLFGGLSDIRSPGVDGPPVMPEDPYTYVVAAFQAPPSPDYVPGPEYPPSPDFVPEPVYPEFMPPEDEVLPTKEHPLLAALSPTADSPGYVPESDHEEDLEEDDDEDPKEDPVDYRADGGDNGDEEDESSDDDEDDDVDIEGDEEEEEHPAPADSAVVALPTVNHAPSAEETKPFETDESATTPPSHPAYRIARLLAIPTPPPSPLSLWSSPLPQIPSPPLPLILSQLPVSSPPPTSPTYLLGYRASMILAGRARPLSSFPLKSYLHHTRADTPPSGTPSSGTPPLLHIPLPASSPSLLLPSADHGADMPEVCLPPRKRLCFAFGPRYKVEESSYAAAARPTRGFREDYASSDRQKSYADVRRKPLKFQVGDKVMLKVSPWKGVIHFGKRGKLNPRYVGPFKIITKVGTVAYRLELLEQLSRLHSTFYVSKLKKCIANEPLAISLDEIQVDEKLEEPVEIMDRVVKRLK